MVYLQLIAFNLGSLGFLTNHCYENFIRDLKGVIYGREELEQCSVDTEDGLAVGLFSLQCSSTGFLHSHAQSRVEFPVWWKVASLWTWW